MIFNKNIASVVRTRATHGGAAEENYEGNVKNVQSFRKVQLSKRAVDILKKRLKLIIDILNSILTIMIMDGFLLQKVIISRIITDSRCITVY